MPANNPSPLPNLTPEVDLRTWAGAVVFYRGATPAGDVTLPSYSGIGDGLYEDLAMALNGAGAGAYYGSKDMGLTASGAGAGGDWTVDVDPDTDRIRIQCTGAGAAAFTVTAASDAFGFPNGVAVASSPITGGHEAVATAEWARANLLGSLATGDHLAMVQGAASWTWPSVQYMAQCPITLLRGRGVIGDLDDQAPFTNVEHLDQAAQSSDQIWWGLTVEGHVFSAWRTGTVSPITWVSTTFRDFLGFTGDESVQSSGLLDYIVGTHPAAPSWCPSRCLQDDYPQVKDPSRARRMETGSYAARHRQQVHQSVIELLVDGPAAPRNLLAHVRRRWWPLARVGRPVTLYPNWLERRRRLLPHQVNAGQPAYDLLYTSEGEGRIGRRRCRMSTDNDESVAFDFGADRIEDRVPVRLTLDERED